MTYRFFYKELKWKFQQPDGTWIEQNPQESPDVLQVVDFVKIWKRCRFMNDVHKYLFWMNETEIMDYLNDVNQALEECGYHPLPHLEYASQGFFSDEELLHLEELGLISKKADFEENVSKSAEETQHNSDLEDDSPSSVTALYNQMKRKNNTYDPLRHVFTTEQGKFSVRH